MGTKDKETKSYIVLLDVNLGNQVSFQQLGITLSIAVSKTWH